MTEMSYLWGGKVTGDAQTALGGAPYSDDEWAYLWSFLLQYDRTTQGPIITNRAGYTGNLFVTNSSGTTIRVATGAAIVDGRLYTNSANIDEDMDGQGTGYYTVVLQKHEANQEVRVVILGPDVGAPPVATQSAAVWEISIATFHFDDGTDTISALTDTRAPTNKPLTRKFFVQATRGENATDGGELDTDHDQGIVTPASKNVSVWGNFIVPMDFGSNMTLTAVIGGGTGSGNLYMYNRGIYAACGEWSSTHNDATALTIIAQVTSNIHCFLELSLGDAAIDDVVKCDFYRNGAHANDTGGDAYFAGWIVEYTPWI